MTVQVSRRPARFCVRAAAARSCAACVLRLHTPGSSSRGEGLCHTHGHAKDRMKHKHHLFNGHASAPSSHSLGSSSSKANLLPAQDDDNGSICWEVYIENEAPDDGKGGSKPSRMQLAAVAHCGADGTGPPDAGRQQQRKRRGCLKLSLILVAVVVVLGLVIGVSVGVAKLAKQKQQGGAVVLQPQQGDTSLPAAVTITVPFEATVLVPPPPGRAKWSCDLLFRDTKARQQFANQLEAEHMQRLSSQQVSEVLLTQLRCNNKSYPLSTAAGGPTTYLMAGAAPAGRRLQQQQPAAQQQPVQRLAPVTRAADKPLTVYVQLQAVRREQLQAVPPVGTYGRWIQQVSSDGAAAARVLVPQVLQHMFELPACETLSVTQLYVEVASSRVVMDGGAGGTVAEQHTWRKGFKGATVVTRTIVDPITGKALHSQTMHVPGLLPTTPPRPATQQPQRPEDDSSSSSSSRTEEDEDEDEYEEREDTATPPAAPAGCGAGCRLPNAASNCVDGVCEVIRCMPGWADCDGHPENGCEAEVTRFFTDRNHCGSCNRVCLAPLSCGAGRCSMPDDEQPQWDDVEEEEEEQPEVPQGPHQGQEGEGAGEGEEEQEPRSQHHLPPAAPEQPGMPPATEQPTEPQQPSQPAEEEQPSKSEEEQQQPQVQPPAPGVVVPAPHRPSKPAVPTHPKVPQKPRKPAEGLAEPHDDVVRITADQTDVILDVLSNDDLKGANPRAVTLSIVAQPSSGSVTVLPADNTAAGARPRLAYRQGASRLAPGDEAEVFYTLAVPGQPTPAPASALVIGSAGPEDSALANCSSAAGSHVKGSPIPALSRADDAAAAIRLPFPVSMFGGSYDTATVSSNGWVSLGESGASEPCSGDGAWPSAACLGTGPVLAPFWDDLVPDQVLTHHDAALGAFIIQWTNVVFANSPLLLGTFQAYLFRNGTVGYVYRDLYGTEQALGTSAVVGIRGPTAQSKAFTARLGSTVFEKAGAGADPYGSWLFSAALDDTSDYFTTVGSHRRFLSPGLALVSHPAGPKQAASKFQAWPTAAGAVAAGRGAHGALQLPLLVSGAAPPRPVVQPAVSAVVGSNGAVRAVTWQAPFAHPHGATFFRLFLSADPVFNELLRQPESVGFKPDMPGSSRSAEVVLPGGGGAAAGQQQQQQRGPSEAYALLLACNPEACSRSCISRISLVQS